MSRTREAVKLVRWATRRTIWNLRKNGMRATLLATRRVLVPHRRYDLPPFKFQDRSYEYLHHPHNRTWSNERSVEVAIAARAIEEEQGRILEVGNVTPNYLPCNHDVVDKYEEANVIRADILDFNPEHKYDLILVLSTLEHIGWDEDPREPAKVLKAIEHIRGLLAPGGRLIATMPLGYNPFLDEQLAGGLFPQLTYLMRVSKRNEWREAGPEEVRGAAYDTPYPAANALAVAQAGPLASD